MLQNLRFAFRVLCKNPAFSVVAICSLAIGIGANSAIFSVADALLLRPLPVLKPRQVVNVRMSSPGEPSSDLSYRDYVDFRDQNRSFGNLAAYSAAKFGVTEANGDTAVVKYGLFTSGNFFRTLGITPSLGRGFRDDEDTVAGRDAVVVLSHDMWENDFAASPAVIGRTLRLNGTELTIIGVAPDHFTGVDQSFRPALYVPISMAPRITRQDRLEDRGTRWLNVKGRLKPDVSVSQAEAELTAIAANLARTYPVTNRSHTARVQTEFQLRVEQDPPDAQLVGMLMVLAGCVLLIACANVAGLQLSRNYARSREFAIRLAVGAKRLQLIGQLLLESLLLALAGGIVGAVIAFFGTKFFSRAQIPTDLPIVIAIRLDYRVLLFTLGAAMASTLLSGLSAFRSTHLNLVPALKNADVDLTGKQRLWGRNALVAGQIAISLILLTVTALIYRGFEGQVSNGPGYRTSHLLLMSFDPSVVGYTPAQTQRFYKELLDRVGSEPTVKSASLTSVVPLAPEQQEQALVPEGYLLPPGQSVVTVSAATVSDHYFQTVGINILRGRSFLSSDTADSPPVAVVNQNLADRYWPNQDCLGKRFHLDGANGPLLQVVGVAQTVKYFWIGEAPTPFLYLPFHQQGRSQMTLATESAGDASKLTALLRRTVHDIDANLPMYNVRTMENFYHQRAVRVPEMVIQTIGCMGIMALILAIIGLYGLVAFSVSRRTREIGIRMATGASRGNVLLMILKQGGRLAAFGIVFGVIGSLGANQAIRSIFTFNGTKAPHLIFLLTAVAQLLAVLLATYVPARRASRLDPIRALRDE